MDGSHSTVCRKIAGAVRARMQAQMVFDCQVSFDENGEVCCFVPRQ